MIMAHQAEFAAALMASFQDHGAPGQFSCHGPSPDQQPGQARNHAHNGKGGNDAKIDQNDPGFVDQQVCHRPARTIAVGFSIRHLMRLS